MEIGIGAEEEKKDALDAYATPEVGVEDVGGDPLD